MSKENKSPFAELLDELDTLQKAFPAEGEEEEQGADEGDAKIQTAADGDRDGDGEPDGTDPDATNEEDEDDEYDDMAKALGVEPMEIVGEDGSKQKAYDGLQVLKAMSVRMQATEGDIASALGAAASTMQGMRKQLTAQDELVKSLQEQVSVISDQGKGRKAVLSVLDKPGGTETALAKSESLTGQEIMSKAMSAQKSGAITGVEVARLDSYLGRGITPPGDLLAKIGLTAG